MTKAKSFVTRLMEEPYRIFFPLAILYGMHGVGHWLALAMKWLDHYLGLVHASIQMQSYMICFVAGFLMTALPRLSSSKPATWVETSGVLLLLTGSWVALCVPHWMSANLFFAASLLWLLFFVLRRMPRRKGQTELNVKFPVEFLWIPFAIFQGIVGGILFALGMHQVVGTWAIGLGKLFVQQGFILSIVLGVGGFMAPRLMGTFKTLQKPTNECCQLKMAKTREREKYFHLLAGALLVGSYVLQCIPGSEVFPRVALGLRACLVTVILVWTRSVVLKPVMKEQYVFHVWISFWMVCVGSWLVFLFPNYRVEALHFIFLGGYSLMTFAVATMVIFSHAGRPELLRKHSKMLSMVAGCVLLSLAFRVACPFVPKSYYFCVGISSLLWLVGAVIWGFKTGPYIFKFTNPEELKERHEAAKQAVLRARQKRTDASG